MINCIIRIYSFLIVSLFCSGILVVSFFCFYFLDYELTTIVYLNPNDFIKKTKQFTQINTEQRTSYIGTTHKRIYLELTTAIDSHGEVYTTIYWTDKEMISTDFIQKWEKINKQLTSKY